MFFICLFIFYFPSSLITENSIKGMIYVLDAWIKGSDDKFVPCWWSVVYIVADYDALHARTIAKEWKG